MHRKEIVDQLQDERDFLEKVIQKTEKLLSQTPEGHLRIQENDQRTQFFQIIEKNDTRGRVIKKKELVLAEELAQKSYYEKLLRNASAELKAIEKFLKQYPEDNLTRVFEQLSETRKTLVRPLIESDEDYIKRWNSIPYIGKGFEENDPEYYTDKGERVRSKTEILIADTLAAYGIPYKYECPIQVNGVGNVYIDFTFLFVKERCQGYLEHFGRMGNAAYVETFMKKINTYSKNGLILGDNLFATFESERYPINTKDLNRFIEMLAKRSLG